MKCKNCGGELTCKTDGYLCESCGSEFAFCAVYEDIDTYICYIETDETGRRTVDSVMAQDIFRTLEQAKIKCFYARISADQLTGDALEQACNAALHSTKTVVLLGTQKTHFEKLAEKYEAFYAGKTVIPVFADMNPYDIPKGISAIQALDYGKVGAGVDLVKGIYNVLGREETLDYGDLVKKTEKRKKVILWGIGIIALLLFAALGCYLYLMGVFDGNSPTTPTTQQTTAETTEATQILTLSPEEIQEEQYNIAVAANESGDYATAMELFSGLPGYKDSNKRLGILYQYYAGYYQSEDGKHNLWLQVWEGNATAVEYSVLTAEGYCAIIETFQMHGNRCEMEFNDSENNRGTLTLELQNEELTIRVATNEVASTVSIGTLEKKFPLDAKSDKPFAPKIEPEQILQMITTPTDLAQLQRQGFELESDSEVYSIRNTEIKFATKVGFEIADTWNNYIALVSALAKMVIPNRIGTPCKAFVENDVLFIPHVDLRRSEGGVAIFELETEAPKVFAEDTPVCMISTLNKDAYKRYVNSYIYEPCAIDAYLKENAQPHTRKPVASVLAENSTHYLIIVQDEEYNIMVYYSFHKNTLETKNIAYSAMYDEQNRYINPAEQYRQHPEYFGAFL